MDHQHFRHGDRVFWFDILSQKKILAGKDSSVHVSKPRAQKSKPNKRLCAGILPSKLLRLSEGLSNTTEALQTRNSHSLEIQR